MAKTYILKEGSIHQKYMELRSKLQFFGGGYGNGKTSAMVAKTLQLCTMYPGMNVLMARSTYPKLNDTLRKVFLEFCPEEWIESFPLSKNSDNTCVLKNGTRLNFRYIAQRKGTDDGGSTSNLLSATYDLAVIDQIEDPEITYKDFIDLMGRMRGSAIFRGNDPTYPRTGPRWLLISANPTRNWVYKKIIEPYHIFKAKGVVKDELLCLREKDTQNPVLIDGKVQLLMDVVEGSTYENAHILPEDFISGLESMYQGQMRDRFLYGQWAAYEGLVYPDYSDGIHTVRHDVALSYLRSLIARGVRVKYIEGYDHGIQSPSCYVLAFVDHMKNIVIIDGFYQKEATIEWQADEIRRIRGTYGVVGSFIFADPTIMRRGATSGKLVGKTVAELFHDYAPEIMFTRGNNDISNGIRKVRSYLQCRDYRQHIIDNSSPAPFLYVSTKCSWAIEEFAGYFWKTDTHGERDDTPTDRNDHAMDAIKYMLSEAPEPGRMLDLSNTIPPYLLEWQEIERQTDVNKYRH